MIDTITDVLKEQQRQLELWGDPGHGFTMWMTLLAEEVGELAKEVVGFTFKKNRLHYLGRMREEAVQVAAITLTIIDQIKITERFISDDGRQQEEGFRLREKDYEEIEQAS